MSSLSFREIQRAMLRKLVNVPKSGDLSLPHMNSDTADMFDFHFDTSNSNNTDKITSNIHQHSLVKSTIPILQVYNANKWLNKKELQRISPNIEFKNVYNGRYSFNLVHNSQYFIEFHSPDDANSYLNNYPSEEIRTLNGLALSPDICNDTFVNSLRFLLFPMLPEISDIPNLIKYCQNSYLSEQSEHKTFTKEKAKINCSLESLFHKMKTRTFSNAKVHSHYSKLIDKLQKNNIDFPQFDRSYCVIVRNVPFQISRHGFKQFLWDLEWFTPNESFENTRCVYIEKETSFRTWVLIFKDSQNALECVSRMNGMHLFYQESLPIVEAEIL